MLDFKSNVRQVLGVYITLSGPLGMCPLEKDNLYLRIRWLISTSSLISMTLFMIYETYLNCEIAEYSVDFLLVISFSLIGLVKLFCCYRHRDELRLNVDSAMEDWSSKDAINFSSIMYRYRTRYNKIARCFIVMATSSAVSYPTKVLFTNSVSIIKVKSREEDENYGNMTTVLRKKFLIPAACSFNNVSESSYWVIIFVQFYQFLICVMVNLCCDAFFIVAANHLCGQFEILKLKFASFEELRNETDTRRRFGTLIARHRRLLKLATHLEISFNIIILTQIIMNLILINVAGFNFLIFLQGGNIVGVMSNLSIMLYTLVHTFMYSYIGDEISSRGQDIVLSIYDSTWYTMPKSLTKDMLFVMIRSSTSVHLTAGKFFKMTRGTFVDVVKTAFSYLSVLHVIIKDRNI